MTTPAAPPGKRKFMFRKTSPFNHPSEVQQAMIDAIQATEPSNGFVVSPCGSGKTAVILQAAMAAGLKVIIFCYESQGVKQMEQALREHTTLFGHQICVHSGKSKGEPHEHWCFLITTYGMFASKEAHRSAQSKRVRDYVYNTNWDLVCCDEGHHVCAKTYRKMLGELHYKRMLGFTATLFRNEFCSATQTRDEHEREAFGWFGTVLFRRTCRELEEAGLIARIRRAAIKVELTPQFRTAYDMAVGPQKKYIASLNPTKLNALKATCEVHKRMGHAGIVFVTHLLSAKVVEKVLGEGWEVLSGGSAHGEDDPRNAEINADIVKRFNAGELVGMICTAVGYSSMDVPLTRFCYVAVVDADGGVASAAQRIGRVARSPRLVRREGESDAALRTRRLEEQKGATYYDFITLDTEDEEAADKRQTLFELEGYGDEIDVPAQGMLDSAKEYDAPLACSGIVAEMLLLKEVLQYKELGKVEKEANAAAAKTKAPQSSKVRAHMANAKQAPSIMGKMLLERKAAQAKKREREIAEEAREVRRKTIDNAPMTKETLAIFRKLDLPLEVLEQADLASACFPPSDDEDNDEFL